jgi:hypothetical protein
MRIKFKDLSKFNKFSYLAFGFTAICGVLYLIIDFNVWVLYLTILFLLKMWDVKIEQKSSNLLDDYSKICFQQAELITDLTVELNEANEKIKKLEDKKTTTKKKPATKKTATKKTVKKETKKNATK